MRVTVPTVRAVRLGSWLRRQARWVDVVLGVVSAAGLLIESGVHGHDRHDVLSVVLALAVGAAVATRRRAPVRALVVTLVLLLVALPVTHSTHSTLAIAMLSAATVAYQGRRVVSAIVGCALVPVVAVAWWIAGGEGVGGEFFGYLVFLLAAVAAGDAIKSRHDAAAARHDREALARQAAAREMFDEYRMQLGRELHDSLAHTLVAIATRAGVAAHLHRGDSDSELISALEDVKRVSADALNQLRATLQSVRDTAAPPLTVSAQTSRITLEDLMKPLDVAGVRVTLDCDPAADQAPTAVRHAGLRIVQESLTNVLRHARAQSVSVSLLVRDNQLLVDVTDDGPPAPPHVAGHGLTGMRERAHEVGGTVTAGSQCPSGWRVHAVLPISSPGRP